MERRAVGCTGGERLSGDTNAVSLAPCSETGSAGGLGPDTDLQHGPSMALMPPAPSLHSWGSVRPDETQAPGSLLHNEPHGVRTPWRRRQHGRKSRVHARFQRPEFESQLRRGLSDRSRQASSGKHSPIIFQVGTLTIIITQPRESESTGGPGGEGQVSRLSPQIPGRILG